MLGAFMGMLFEDASWIGYEIIEKGCAVRCICRNRHASCFEPSQRSIHRKKERGIMVIPLKANERHKLNTTESFKIQQPKVP